MNEYYIQQPDVAPGTKARSVDFNAVDAAVDAAFDKLPSPSTLARGSINYVQDTGTVENSYVAALPNVTIYTDGLSIKLNSTRANTGPATLNVSGIGAIAIKRADGVDLQADDITPNSPISLTFVAATNRFVLANTASSQIKQAEASATQAANSAANAASSANNAASSASNAAGSATSSANSATQAANSAASVNKDVSNGTAGLTGFAINLKNAAGTVVSKLASIATAVRTWTFPDKSGTVALLDDVTGKNVIINPSFTINQRAVTGTVTLAAGTYGHDRWKAGAAGCTYTFASNGCDTTITITVGSLMQVIDSVNVEGGIYTLSRTGTAAARIGVNGVAPSGAYAATPMTSTSATAGQAVTVEFSAGTIGKVQLEIGANATVFERRLMGAELALCQRYFERVSTADMYTGNRANGTGLTIYADFKFAVEKRATPTVTFGTPTCWDTAGVTQTPTEWYGRSIGTQGFTLVCTHPNGVAGLQANTHFASAEL